ncbi:MAG: class I SAM-dependent methyltransferase [Pirellulales bacterium]
MPESDRQKWDAKYRSADDVPVEPSAVLTSLSHLIPSAGAALDIAGGGGRHAIWLARHGLDVTIADISVVGLELAIGRAEVADVRISTMPTDLEASSFPPGPWKMIFSHHFLWRPLFRQYPKVLEDEGVLVVIQPTLKNLKRHEKPPAQFLLDDGELPTLVGDLDVIHYEEGWLAEGRHEAVVVARRSRP